MSGAVVTLDRPGAVLQGAIVRGGVNVTADGATVHDVRVLGPLGDASGLSVPTAFALGALIGAVVWRWSR